MIDYKDALSRLKNKFDQVKDFIYERVEPRKKIYWLRSKYRFIRRKWREYIKPRLRYIAFEFAPNTLAYGVLFTIPGAFFFGLEISLFAVVSFGFGWYILFVEVPEVIKEIIPYIKVKVDN